MVALTSALLLLLLAGGCGQAENLRSVFRPDQTPREAYAETLREAGALETALGRAWQAAGERALAEAARVEAPFREVGYLNPAEPAAAGYRIGVRRGQELRIRVTLPDDSTRLFADLFEVPEDTARAPAPLASADTTGRLAVEAERDGDLLLRVQPELLGGGRYVIEIEAGASLAAFPVSGEDSRAIRSFFGDARDGGARDHHGVDIFAERGTPVVSATGGLVTRTGNGGRGGKTVWVRDVGRGRAFYYAHLDSQLVRAPARVEAGDTLGLVGNTGNARTTPPHLHFGLYAGGPVDPYPFVHEPRAEAAAPSADTTRLGRWSRIAVARANLRAGPTTQADVLRRLPQGTALRLAGTSGAWHRVLLPDGTAGYLAASLLLPAEAPLRTLRLADGALALQRPQPGAPAIDSLAAGAEAPVLGTFGAFALVELPRARTGWVPSDAG